jgi:hypothetical protein
MAMAQRQRGSAPAAAWKQFAAEAEPELRRFEAAMKAPRERQERRLQQILRANVGTQFGREHGFGTVESIRDFRNRVPESDWTSVSCWVDRAKAGEKRVLTAEDPVHFERTSGSGAPQKDIPYTTALMREFQSALVVWLATLVRDCPAIAGPSYWSLSPDRSPPELTDAGITVGSASDASYLADCPAERLLPTVVGTRALREASRDWQLETLRSIAAEADLRMLSVWSPTFLLSLLDVVLDPSRRGSSMDALRKDLPQDRSTALSSAIEHRDFTKLWPSLAVISCWTDGPSAEFSTLLEALFPSTRIAPKGLFATEGVVSISWGAGLARPVAITSHFLEFVADDGAARTVDELELGRRYRPLLTTSGGLYRYRLGDVVEVTSFIEKTPCIQFIGRDDSRSDLVGEKIDERIVSAALRKAHLPGPAILVPVANARPPRYLLITECHADRAAERIESELCRVHHYSIARRNHQLAAVASRRVANLAALVHEAWQATGRRSGDAKPSSLIVSADFAAALIRTLQPARRDRAGG